MTSIKISGSHEELEIIELLSAEVCREHEIIAKIQVSEFRTDSIEAEQVLPILSVTFSGVIAIVQIVNLVLNIQERKSKAVESKSTPLSIAIEASNGKELEFKFTGNLTKEEVKKYLSSTQKFIDDFLQDDDGISLKRLQLEGNISLADIEKINLLFRGLLSKLTDIRKWQSLPPRNDGEIIYYDSTSDNVSLKELICESREKRIYLNCEEAESCNKLFYILERENILNFHKAGTDFRVIDMENIFVRYEIEELSLFREIICHKNFILNNISSSAEEF